MRICGRPEAIRDLTYKELQFAIELKAVGIEEQTLDLIRKYEIFDRTIITSGTWQALKNVHAIEPQMRLGYLAHILNDALLVAAKDCGIGQICPKADVLNQYLAD